MEPYMYTPSSTSQSFRTNLAQLVTPLRRVRPRVPFWHLAAHRIPTLWGLYRGLLRGVNEFRKSEDAGGEERKILRERIRTLARKNQHLTGTKQTTDSLEFGYKLLNYLDQSATSSHHANVLTRYASFLKYKEESSEWRDLFLKHFPPFAKSLPPEHPLYQQPKPIFTGGIIRGSLYLPPMPRMKPQPIQVSMLYRSRMMKREKRLRRLEALERTINDIYIEAKAEEELMRECEKMGLKTWKPIWWDGKPVKREMPKKPGKDNEKRNAPKHPPSAKARLSWIMPLRIAANETWRLLGMDHERKKMAPSPELLEVVREARMEKIRNKTRELERERRGHILERTRKRARKGPPAHILVKWSEKRRRMEEIARSSVTESGYVGLVKKRLGWKLKDPDAWRKEEGKGGPEVEALSKEIREEIERRAELLKKAD